MHFKLHDDFVRSLPGDPPNDPGAERRSRRVAGVCWSPVAPTPVRAPKLVAWSRDVASLLELSDEPDRNLVDALAGNQRIEGSVPYAARYGGHQFGTWAGQLGDGRAICLGERMTSHGERFELQLKGAGVTPYSRRADGRAVLRSSIREFLCSEAMHHLGVPTTRALSLIATGELVERDMFYDGHPRMEPGAVVCRVAPSFLRFGSFEILRADDEPALLRTLVDYAIDRFDPSLGAPSPERTARWLTELARRTGTLIAAWMTYGFVHGVMNTDNMSALGLTIDYGPYGWLDAFDAHWTPNTSDEPGRRYRYGQQPYMGLWNIAQLAGALRSLLRDAGDVHAALAAYRTAYNDAYTQRMATRLGLTTPDDSLLTELHAVMSVVETDYNEFLRALGDVPEAARNDAALVAPLERALYRERPPGLTARTAAWVRALRARVEAEGCTHALWQARVRAANPVFVLRNWVTQQAIDAAEAGDFTPVRALLAAARRPYEMPAGGSAVVGLRPEWARSKPGCSALSCSS